MSKLLTQSQDVFAQGYEDLKKFRNGEYVHHISLKPRVTTFRRKLRSYNPKVFEAIFKEVEKMLKACIIYPIHHSTQVANIVPGRKKNGEIRICVYFRNLNQASLKDNYALSTMDHILQIVVEFEVMSMLDGYLGYNQIRVAPEDQHKIAFITPWGTFDYNQIPFGLINVGETIQSEMNFFFKDLSDRIIVIYLDDLIVYSKRRKHHLRDLGIVLDQCRHNGISLNPKKIMFFVEERKFLRHIISKEGIRIYLERLKVIQKLALLTNRSNLKSFSQVKFLRSFVLEFSKKVRYMLGMMRKKDPFRWQEEGKKALQDIKTTISNAPMLVSPKFEKDFIIYYYALEHTLSSILTQKDDGDNEAPIAIMSIPLKKHELNYTQMEKDAFVMVKALKEFSQYILHSHSIFYVSEPTVKSILTQQEIGVNKIVAWITKVNEYDLTTKPNSLVRAQILYRLIVENKDSPLDNIKEMPLILLASSIDPQFSNVTYFLTYGECPPNMNYKEKLNLRLKATKYIISNGILYKTGIDGTFFRCVDVEQQEKLLRAYHSNICRGNFSSIVTIFEILRNLFCWLGMFKDAYKFVKNCE